jgi:type VI protein secretion system component Hcp
MKTRTLIVVAVAVALAALGGLVFWALASGDDSTTERRAGALGAFPSSLNSQVTIPNVNKGAALKAEPFALSAASAGGTTTGDKYGTGMVQYEPLQFNRQLDEVSLELLDQAIRGIVHPLVTVELRGGETNAVMLSYDLQKASISTESEGATGTDRARQDVAIGFGPLVVKPPSAELGYAPAEGALGRLVIPGVADESGKPANVVAYKWGYERQLATATSPGRMVANAIELTRRIDMHAVWFWQRLQAGTVIPDMLLKLITDVGTGPVTYMSYRLRNVQVAALTDSGGAQPTQQITLRFQRLEAVSGTKMVLLDTAATKY